VLVECSTTTPDRSGDGASRGGEGDWARVEEVVHVLDLRRYGQVAYGRPACQVVEADGEQSHAQSTQ